MKADMKEIDSLRSALSAVQKDRSCNSITVFFTGRKPLRLDYQIDSFEIEKEYANTEDEKREVERKLDLFHGMYATFGFQSRGKVQFNGKSYFANLQVNSLNSSEFLKYGNEGRIGDGWFEGKEFLFRLHISPTMVKDILIFRSLFKNVIPAVSSDETDMLLGADGDFSLSSMYGYDPGLGIDDPFFFLRLELELGSSFKPEMIGYSIKTLYMQ